MPGTGKSPPHSPTLIPEKYLDIPSQRLYYLSFGLLCQAIKVFDFFQHRFSSHDGHTNYSKKWLFVDFAYIVILSQLRIPRLNYSKSVVLLHIVSIWFLDGLLFGGVSLNWAHGSTGRGSSSLGLQHEPEVPSTPEPFHISDFLASFGFGFLHTASYSGKDSHLLGQHTVRMSPISTAQLNPYGQTFCLGSPGTSVLVPILLNNTDPSLVKYSLVPLGYVEEGEYRNGKTVGKVELREVSRRDLKTMEQKLAEGSQPSPLQAAYDAEEYDEYDDEEDGGGDESGVSSSLQETQSLQYIRLSKPGTVRLERVLDVSHTDARITHPAEVTVAPCPSVEFIDDKISSHEQHVQCAGQDPDMELTIDIRGVPPLSLRWYKEINGKREYFLVEGIEGGHEGHDHSAPTTPAHGGQRCNNLPQDLKVPLSLSLATLGSHVYVLEEVTDGLGNIIHLSPDASSVLPESHKRGSLARINSKTVRTLSVLRRPTFAFKHCGPGNPTSYLIGSEAPLTVSAIDADPLDAPWDVTLKYLPPQPADDRSKSKSKRFKPWQRTTQTQNDRRELVVRANAPGEYTIVRVKGKWCDGDVLAPESCDVVEKPLPTAEIAWKRIHECSGDTGISASLVLHGTPPFQVYYRSQADNLSPEEHVKTFTSSRGEITLQPTYSGHYVYTFLQISDANYQKVELNGPSIDQVVHPLASAHFVDNDYQYARTKKKINSCSGNALDVEVLLRGEKPFNLEVQIVGPNSAETVQINDINKTMPLVHLPIPKEIDKHGGSFEVDIVSIEDSHGCKRTVSVPGLTVNVRRVKPTAKFYGKDDNRHVSVLEGEPATLPLRLTGEAPWQIKYRRAEEETRVHTATLTSHNDKLHVTEKGLFEIIDVMDSQCPGSILSDAATYRVDWIARPSAKLSAQTPSSYESYNNSYILPPVCEGSYDHVDLELTGRPPFQIMYNIAQNSQTRPGTDLLDQPTFSSIQHSTRFQLHTSSSGRMYYEVKQIGDASYPLSKHRAAVIPRSARLLFEQHVLKRPSAGFKTSSRIPYCLYDPFTPRDSPTQEGMVILEGTPPFQLELSIKNLAASQVSVKTVEVLEKAWKIDLPSHTFKSIGPHLVTIESVHDASHCQQAVLDPLARSVWVDVAETAAIFPFDRRDDFCVGDISQFQLEGTPPWTIGYRINGKAYTADAKTSPFALLHQQPGEFTITSIAHQQKMCKAAVTDLRFTVRPLPAAQVGHGRRIYQDIHEGDQAEIVFTLVGEPPFTFTYQRSEPPSKKGGKPGRVLETHTVSGVSVKEFSVYSALEGTWTVTSISDRYCRYPPIQRDGTVDKSRH